MTGFGGNITKLCREREIFATNAPEDAARKKDIRGSSVITDMSGRTVVIAQDENKVFSVVRLLANEKHVLVKAHKRRKRGEIGTGLTLAVDMVKHTALGD